ncbi:hypothetical protein BDR04DRAFT_1153461 [Suillus decipiens]|nr:hypothetical protein BDR04DRAFT_1153461 [Suillus decipiens]
MASAIAHKLISHRQHVEGEAAVLMFLPEQSGHHDHGSKDDALPAGSDHNESESSAEDDDADVARQPAEDRISPSPPPRKAKGKRKALSVPTAESDYNDDEESEPDEDHFSPPPPARKAKGQGKALPVPVDDEDAYNSPPVDGSNHDADADADVDADYPLTPGRLL